MLFYRLLPSLLQWEISSLVRSTIALCQLQTVATRRFCSPELPPATHLLLAGPRVTKVDTHISFDTSFFCWSGFPSVGEGAWALGHPKESPVPVPLQHPCVPGEQPAEKAGAFPRDRQEGLLTELWTPQGEALSDIWVLRGDARGRDHLRTSGGGRTASRSRLIPKQQRSSHANLPWAGGMHVIREEWQRWGQSLQQRKTKFFQCFQRR